MIDFWYFYRQLTNRPFWRDDDQSILIRFLDAILDQNLIKFVTANFVKFGILCLFFFFVLWQVCTNLNYRKMKEKNIAYITRDVVKICPHVTFERNRSTPFNIKTDVSAENTT